MSRTVLHPVRPASVSHPGALVRALAASRELWAPHVRFDPSAPHTALVWADDRHEAHIGAWLPGQASPVHAHLGRPGALLVLQGVLEETTWVTATDGAEPGRRHAVRRHLAADQVRSYGAVHVHGLRNDGTDPVVALHVIARADQRDGVTGD
jgi:predicted metal-dependent enzyme (double-stranded beta helix superfamily)